MTQKNSLQLGQQGTALWGINRLRSDALSSLLDDLMLAEKTGLEDLKCDPIKNFLGFMTNDATRLEDGTLFSPPLWKAFNKMEKIYKSWNDDAKGSDVKSVKHRVKQFHKLRKIRHHISKKIRKHGHIIQENLDLKLIDEAYKALGEVVAAGPETFKNLSKAVARFEKFGIE